MSNRVVVVTGGTRGIGRAIVERFAAEGDRVFFTGRSDSSVMAAALGLPESCVGAVCDVAEEEAVKKYFASVVELAGTVDVLINNAGIARDGLLMRMKGDQWDEVMATNLRGAFLCTQAVLRPMMKNPEGGRIINISSVIGVVGNAGQANYAASKAGLIGFTKSVAQEVASRKILANAIAPGFIETDMTDGLSPAQKEGILARVPLGTLGRPEDVAGVCVFLAGPDAAYITGQVFHVDGGMVMAG